MRAKLWQLQDKDYQKFSKKLKLGDKIIGVRMPWVRKLAKEIIKNNKFDFLRNYKCEFYEEFAIFAIVLCSLEDEQKLEFAKDFITKIDNWSICDLFCSGVKPKNIKIWLPFIKTLKEKDEFQARVYFVFGLFYFLKDELVDEFLDDCVNNKNEAYYVQMAVAWALCEAYIFYKDKVFEILKDKKLNRFTHNKTIQKICESLRVDKVDKEKIKLLRIKARDVF